MRINPVLLAGFDIDELPSEHAPAVIRTNYSCYWPETRQVVDDLWGARLHRIFERAYQKRQEKLPPIFLDRWREWSGIPLDGFGHAAVTSGASEPIKDLVLTGGIPFRTSRGAVYLFEGEYDGYWQFAKSVGRRYVHVPRNLKAALAVRYGENATFWISQPSAIDGDYWPELDQFLIEMKRRHPHVRIYLDVTYVGGVSRVQPIDPSRHPNVRAVVFSLSKPFGVYYHRIGGIWSRDEIPTMSANVWFMNPFSLCVGWELMARFGVDEIPKKYHRDQLTVVRAAKQDRLLPPEAQAANVIITAHSPVGDAEFRRAPDHYRWCVTPGLDRLVNGGVN